MQIPMSFEHYQRIPRHPDWKAEYWDGALHLSYRPFAIHLWRDIRMSVPDVRRHDVRLIDGIGDSERLRAFLSEVWREEDPCRTFDEEVTAEWLRYGLDTSFARLTEPAGAIAEERDGIVGAVLLERPFRDEEETAPHLSWLSVRSGYRCDGIGTSLLVAVIEALRPSGVERLNSSVSPGNRASLAWHWRNGFEAVPDPLAAFSRHARRR